jgi:hypothetical protein
MAAFGGSCIAEDDPSRLRPYEPRCTIAALISDPNDSQPNGQVVVFTHRQGWVDGRDEWSGGQALLGGVTFPFPLGIYDFREFVYLPPWPVAVERTVATFFTAGPANVPITTLELQDRYGAWSALAPPLTSTNEFGLRTKALTGTRVAAHVQLGGLHLRACTWRKRNETPCGGPLDPCPREENPAAILSATSSPLVSVSRPGMPAPTRTYTFQDLLRDQGAFVGAGDLSATPSDMSCAYQPDGDALDVCIAVEGEIRHAHFESFDAASLTFRHGSRWQQISRVTSTANEDPLPLGALGNVHTVRCLPSRGGFHLFGLTKARSGEYLFHAYRKPSGEWEYDKEFDLQIGDGSGLSAMDVGQCPLSPGRVSEQAVYVAWTGGLRTSVRAFSESPLRWGAGTPSATRISPVSALEFPGRQMGTPTCSACFGRAEALRVYTRPFGPEPP